MPRMIRVKVERTFQRHTAGDVLLVEETAEVKALVKSRLLSLLAVESDGKPAKPAATSKSKAGNAKSKAGNAKSKAANSKSGTSKSKKAGKNV